MVGLKPIYYRVLFFTLLSACVVAALQAVGAILVIFMVVTLGASAYLLSDHFKGLVCLAMTFDIVSSTLGAYLSYFLDGVTGGLIVSLQTLFFLLAFFPT